MKSVRGNPSMSGVSRLPPRSLSAFIWLSPSPAPQPNCCRGGGTMIPWFDSRLPNSPFLAPPPSRHTHTQKKKGADPASQRPRAHLRVNL